MIRVIKNRNPVGLETRGRPREREPRTAGAMKGRSRDRDFGRNPKRKSRSPPRNKVVGMHSSINNNNSRSRPLQNHDLDRRLESGGERMDVNRDSHRRSSDNRGRSREKKRLISSGKLRMDHNRERVPADKEAQVNRKRLGELDRVVKRAREERSSYWNKRVLEAEEKDPNRWGHSGFKELYRKDMKMGNSRRSESPSLKDFQRSQDKFRKMRPPADNRAGHRGRSKSPRSKHKMRSTKPGPSAVNHRSPPSLMDISARGSPMMDDRRGDAFRGGWSEKRDRIRRKSPTHSRSRTTSSMSPPAKVKRTNNLGPSKSNKDGWSRNADKMDISPGRSFSRSMSTSSSSTNDGDVLELHAKSRRRGSSISSRSSSSSSDSATSSSSASTTRRKKASGSSSSSSSSDSDSDDDSDVSGKIDSRRRTGTNASDKVEGNSFKSKTSQDNRPGTKRPPSGVSGGVKNKIPRKSGTSRSTGKYRDDSDSESGSTSDSDSEPRMTLSERFAKLTQMSTDKREFAKPVLAMNEIDTKLKVVKDLRNADVKIYADGIPPHRPENSPSTKVRPKSPEYHHAEGEKQYTSDERRRHFERMAKDEPRERPSDWSDSRVRFEYYRDRGYFNDRPLTFDEYAKWEQWWYEYRDWLESEGYYSRMETAANIRSGHPPYLSKDLVARGSPRGGPPVEWSHSPPAGAAGIPGRLRSSPGQPLLRTPPSRRVEQVPVHIMPLSSRPHFMTGRHDIRGGRGGIQVSNIPGLGRSIDRAPGGSLIVNIRQGGGFGPRGRHVGVVTRRRWGDPNK